MLGDARGAQSLPEGVRLGSNDSYVTAPNPSNNIKACVHLVLNSCGMSVSALLITTPTWQELTHKRDERVL